jgi:hypothetical protein
MQPGNLWSALKSSVTFSRKQNDLARSTANPIYLTESQRIFLQNKAMSATTVSAAGGALLAALFTYKYGYMLALQFVRIISDMPSLPMLWLAERDDVQNRVKFPSSFFSYHPALLGFGWLALSPLAIGYLRESKKAKDKEVLCV